MENLLKKIILTNIQRFSLHDGPGIRTTVFLKGCSLRCPWCCNPENLCNQIQNYIKDGNSGVYGKYYTADEVYKEVIKDKKFYNGEVNDYKITEPFLLDKLPGGVTFSGGECIMQIKQIEPLIEKLKEEHIHMAVETCLFAPQENVNLAIKYIDLFYVDMKILDSKLCEKHQNGRMELYMSNLNVLLNTGKPIVIRIPVIGGYTDGIENRSAICKFLDMHKKRLLKVELIKEHNFGLSKYKSLIDAGNTGFNEPVYKGVSNSLMEMYKTEIEKIGLWVEVCKI